MMIWWICHVIIYVASCVLSTAVFMRVTVCVCQLAILSVN